MAADQGGGEALNSAPAHCTVRENTVDAYLLAVRATITQQGAWGAPGSNRVMPD